MVGTYVSALVVLVASAMVGQAILALCGRRDWSWLAPALGLAALCALCWGALSLTGEPAAALATVGVAASLAMLAWPGGIAMPWDLSAAARERIRGHLEIGAPVAVLALLLASLPFLVEQRFGILGTSLNPDMSQHLFAADRLASGGEERLAAEGYPLGPHALVVGLSQLGPGLVQAFGGLTLAVAMIAALTPLALLERLGRARRLVAALLVGLAYMASSYLVQGAFKETMQALFVLAFAIALHELSAGSLGGRRPDERWRYLRAVPLAVLAAGSIYAYSFPGLAWLIGAVGIWGIAELVAARGLGPLRSGLAAAGCAAVVLIAAIAPEAGRISTFAEFETFDPDGAGLGNLFNAISPLEALGIWPSGDFRLDPGAGFAPASAFWLGGLVALTALGYGLSRWLRRGERAVPAALVAAALLYGYALVDGTPYQEAKAIVVAAPLVMLITLRALFATAPQLVDVLPPGGSQGRPDEGSAGWGRGRHGAVGALAIAFAGLAAGCSLLALANGPVGPSQWGPGLIELRAGGELGPGGENGYDTLILAPEELLVDQHGEDLLLWELRGGNVCTGALAGETAKPSAGVENVVVYRGPGSFEVTSVAEPEPGPHCPFVADGARADPEADPPE